MNDEQQQQQQRERRHRRPLLAGTVSLLALTASVVGVVLHRHHYHHHHGTTNRNSVSSVADHHSSIRRRNQEAVEEVATPYATPQAEAMVAEVVAEEEEYKVMPAYDYEDISNDPMPILLAAPDIMPINIDANGDMATGGNTPLPYDESAASSNGQEDENTIAPPSAMECETNGSTTLNPGANPDKACPTGQFCHLAPGACRNVNSTASNTATGICKVLAPSMCMALYQPVCGCDGRNYSSECSATTSGVSIYHEGECSSAKTHSEPSAEVVGIPTIIQPVASAQDDAAYSNNVCDTNAACQGEGSTCNNGQTEKCCGNTHYSFVCVCSKEGRYLCSNTDACMHPACDDGHPPDKNTPLEDSSTAPRVTPAAPATIHRSRPFPPPPGLKVDIYEGSEECDEEGTVQYGNALSVRYTGSIDASSATGEVGQVFHSNPATLAFALGVDLWLIAGWNLGLIGLCQGDKATLVIPPEFGYGDFGYGEDGPFGEIPGGATLHFDVEIVAVNDVPSVFEQIDSNSDGKLDNEEVGDHFEAIGRPLTPGSTVWEREDTNKDGLISWSEFSGPKGNEDPSVISWSEFSGPKPNEDPSAAATITGDHTPIIEPVVTADRKYIPCSPDAECREEGSTCTNGQTEYCCGETYDSFICTCKNERYSDCHYTDACMLPECDENTLVDDPEPFAPLPAAPAPTKIEVTVDVYEGPTQCDDAHKVEAGDHVSIHYTGTIDETSATGVQFDSTRLKNHTRDFYVGNDARMIPGWEQGIIGLCVGAKATLVIPPELGYGDNGGGGPLGTIPGGATLHFDVEVVAIGYKPSTFEEIDTNSDGKLEIIEVQSHIHGLAEHAEEAWQNWGKEDVNEDTFISWGEFSGPKGEDPSASDSIIAEDAIGLVMVDSQYEDTHVDDSEPAAPVPIGVIVDVYEGPTECKDDHKVQMGDHLSMHYTGAIDKSSTTGEIGRQFDSSRNRGHMFDFVIGSGQVIMGWDQGIVGLCLGAKASLVIPPELGYGDRGAGGAIPGGATLLFFVEVVAIDRKTEVFDVSNWFELIDANSDGKLDLEEATVWFEGTSTEGASAVWARDDEDKDGFVSWAEFSGPKGDTDPSAGDGIDPIDLVVSEIGDAVCDINAVCFEEGSRCTNGKTESCCGETHDSFVCFCSNGEYACMNTDACMHPACEHENNFVDDPATTTMPTTLSDGPAFNQALCVVNGECSDEGSRCTNGETETCCGETHDSFVCFCSNGEYACMNTDACMHPACEHETTISATTTTQLTTTTTPRPGDATTQATVTSATVAALTNPLKWYPIEVDPGASLGGKVQCRHGTDYPLNYYADETIRLYTLFDSHDECCTAFQGCLPEHWYPALSAMSIDDRGDQDGDGVILLSCLYGNDYPVEFLHLRDELNEILFESEEECCEWFPLACVGNEANDWASATPSTAAPGVTTQDPPASITIAPTSSTSPTTAPIDPCTNCTWHQSTRAFRTCSNDPQYPPSWDESEAAHAYFFFHSADECCETRFPGEHLGCNIIDVTSVTDSDFLPIARGELITEHFGSDTMVLPFVIEGSPPQWENDGDALTNVPNPGIKGATASVTLRINLTTPATLQCAARIDTSMPYEYFAMYVNGVQRNVYYSNAQGLHNLVQTHLGVGDITIEFRVTNSDTDLNQVHGENGVRLVDVLGTGRVWLDACEIGDI